MSSGGAEPKKRQGERDPAASLHWYLCNTCSFEGADIVAALSATFIRRQTEFPANGLPQALTEEFFGHATKRQQWSAFLGKAKLRKGVDGLPPLIQQIREFLQPPLMALAEHREFDLHWSPEDGWVTAKALGDIMR